MNLGTLEINSKGVPQRNFPTREELSVFFDDCHQARNLTEPGEVPIVEASRKIVEHFNMGKMAGISSVGYFIYEGIKVYEKGKREIAEKLENMSSNDKAFGKVEEVKAIQKELSGK